MMEPSNSVGDISTDDANSGDDFKDPLGVKDPLIYGLGDGIDSVDTEPANVSQTSSLDIDELVAQAKTELCNITLDYDLDTETKDLFVLVDNPEKHTTTMESYITFRITTKTTRSEFDSHEYQVRRRYNDFLWLRQRLEETQPTHLVPPLPEKHSLKRLDRFSQEFVKTRMIALNKFLQRIAEHPVLSFNKNFCTFLTAKQAEFQSAKKDGSGLISRMADSFHNMSASYMMKNRPTEFIVMQEYIQEFSEKLAVLDRISQRILKEQYDYLADMNEWGPVFTLWSNSEDKLTQALSAMAKSVEICFLSLQESLDASEVKFSHPLREYQLYADSIKAVLRRRDAIQVEYEMTVEELNRKKEEREQQQVDEVVVSDKSSFLGSLWGKNTEDVKHDKEDKLQQQTNELSKQVEILSDKTVCADSDLKADMERWHKMKQKDFRSLFMDMADRQIKYYEKCLKAWEEAIPLIQRTDQLIDTNTESETNQETKDS